jgi:hypothetical protein
LRVKGGAGRKAGNFYQRAVLLTMMKTPPILLSCLLAGLVSVCAQTNPVTPTTIPVDNKQSQSTPAHHAKKDLLTNLTNTERQQLKAAMKKIKDDPQLVAARQAIKESQTKEAKVAAHQALNQTRHDLLLKADPAIQPILDKIVVVKPIQPTKPNQ